MISVIRQGLNAGEQVVVDGADKLQNGTRSSLPHESTSSRKSPGEFGAGNTPVSPSRPFILRPVATSLLMVGVLLAGAVAYFQLPVSALAAGRLSDDTGPDVLSRRQPGRDGFGRDHAARAAVRRSARV